MKQVLFFLLISCISIHGMDQNPLDRCSEQAKLLISEIRFSGSENEKIIASFFIAKLRNSSYQYTLDKEEADFLKKIDKERAQQPSPRYASMLACIEGCTKALQDANVHTIQSQVDQILYARNSITPLEWYITSWFHKQKDKEILKDLFDQYDLSFPRETYKGLLKCTQPEQVTVLYRQAQRICNAKKYITQSFFPQEHLRKFPLATWNEKPGCMIGFLQLGLPINPAHVLHDAINDYNNLQYPALVSVLLHQRPECCKTDHLISVLKHLTWLCNNDENKEKYFSSMRELIEKVLRQNGNRHDSAFHKYADCVSGNPKCQFKWLITNGYNPNNEYNGKKVLDIVISDAYNSMNSTTGYPAIFLKNLDLLISKGAMVSHDHSQALTRKKEWLDQTSAEFHGLSTSCDTQKPEDKDESVFIGQLLERVRTIPIA